MKASAQTALAVLLRGEHHGFAILDAVRVATGACIVISEGSIYPTLREMEARGLLRSRSTPVEGRSGGRPRVCYVLTPAGRRVAEKERAAVAALWGLRIPEKPAGEETTTHGRTATDEGDW